MLLKALFVCVCECVCACMCACSITHVILNLNGASLRCRFALLLRPVIGRFLDRPERKLNPCMHLVEQEQEL